MKFSYKHWGLRLKFEIYILSITIVIISLLLTFIFYQSQKTLKEEAYGQARAQSEAIANWFKLTLEQPAFTARDLGYTMLTLRKAGAVDRNQAQDICKKMMEDNPNYVSVWSTFELNAFDGKDTAFTSGFEHSTETGRFSPGYYRDKGVVKISPAISENEVLSADYYNLPKNSQKEVILEPYYYSYSGDKKDEILETSICIPIIENGNFIGVSGVDVSLQTLVDYNNKQKFYETGYGQLISNQGVVAAHPDTAQILKFSEAISGESKDKILSAIQKGEIVASEEYSSQLKKEVYKVFAPIKIGKSEYFWSYCIVVPKEEILASGKNNLIRMIWFAFFGVLVLGFSIRLLLKKIIKPITIATRGIQQLSLGIIDDQAKLQINTLDELGDMAKAVNKLIDGLKEKSVFSKKIGQGILDAEFTTLSEQDELGNSLLEMRQSLQKAELDEISRKAEDDKRNWATEGLAIFGDILRLNNDNINTLSYQIISNLVKYLKINQGGIFIYNNDNEINPVLELTACYAYDRKKFLSKQVGINEGLIGACFKEKKSIYLTQIPKDYVHITSGLGDENPRCILITPLKLNEEVYGVMEMASFSVLQKHEIDFIERVAENIASTISSVKINMQTSILLKQTQEQTEMMRAQEEEMRQNMEEMHATQEEMARKEANMQEIIEAMKQKEEEYINQIQSLQSNIKQ